MEIEKKTKPEWSPWGEAFLEDNFLMVPYGVVEILRRSGFNHAGVSVVLEIMAHVRKGTCLKFSVREIARKAACSKNTVVCAVSWMGKNGLKRLSEGYPGQSSEYDIMGFLGWLALRRSELSV